MTDRFIVPFLYYRIPKPDCHGSESAKTQSIAGVFMFAVILTTSLMIYQMRRAVRDYKYEINEGRMTDECIQYLAQLQKDWERHRVKVGVEALRKEVWSGHLCLWC